MHNLRSNLPAAPEVSPDGLQSRYRSGAQEAGTANDCPSRRYVGRQGRALLPQRVVSRWAYGKIPGETRPARSGGSRYSRAVVLAAHPRRSRCGLGLAGRPGPLPDIELPDIEEHQGMKDLDMAAIRHCRHCWGDCLGGCLLGDTGMCIHGWNSRKPRMRARWLLSRRWWRRVFWGIG